jgi:2,4-dienoyl-CoA reductase-like NADH-dependent reductase (Old Yellow Enzyme family)
MAHLFDPLAIRDITFANRLFVSPMCQYSSTDASPTTGTSCIWAAGQSEERAWCSPKPAPF